MWIDSSTNEIVERLVITQKDPRAPFVTASPSPAPSLAPTALPTDAPTYIPGSPTPDPTLAPSATPTLAPTNKPTAFANGTLYLLAYYWQPEVRDRDQISGLSWPAELACVGLSWAMLGCPGLYLAILSCAGLCWAMLGCPGLSWAGLSACAGRLAAVYCVRALRVRL